MWWRPSVYSISPITTTPTMSDRAGRLAACPDVDALYIKDPGGLLAPGRARTLIPAIKAAMGDKPWSCTPTAPSAWASSSYMDAPDYGVQLRAVRVRRRRGRTSNPPSERVTANLRELGHTLNRDAAWPKSPLLHPPGRGEDCGRPPQAFDAAYLHHQPPRGVVATMRRHLASTGWSASRAR